MGKRFVPGSERVNLSSNRYKMPGMFIHIGVLFVLAVVLAKYAERICPW